jgi:hypothetical protein
MSAITTAGCGRTMPNRSEPLAPGNFEAALTLADDRDAAMQSLASCGWSHRRIGRLLGLHGTTVARTLERILTLPSIEPEPVPLSAIEIYNLVLEYEGDVNLSQDERAEAMDWLESHRPRKRRRKAHSV